MKKLLQRGISLFLGVCLMLSILALPGVTIAKAEEIVIPAGVNLISSGAFEKESDTAPGTFVADSEGWGNTSMYEIVENTEAADIEKVGHYSLKMVTGAGASTATYWLGKVNGGKTYTFSLNWKGNFSVGNPQFLIAYKDANNTLIGDQVKKTLTITEPDKWLDFTFTEIIPENAVNIQITLNCAKTSVGTVYFDNVSVVEKPDKFELKGATVDMGDTLDMNFYIDPAQLIKLADGETYTAEFFRSYSDGSEEVMTTVTLDPTKVDANNNNYIYVTYSDIDAKEMGDTIEVTILDSNGDSVSKTWTDSVKDYLTRVMTDNADNAKLVALCKDMLNYGAAAQEFFGYGTDNLINADLADKTIRAVEVTGEAVASEFKRGTALTLKNNILMEMFFYKEKVTEGMTAKVSYTNHEGTLVEKDVALTEDTQYVDCWSVKIDGLVMADINTAVTVTIFNGTEKVAEVTDTMAWYVERSADADIFDAILALGDSAYAYCH